MIATLAPQQDPQQDLSQQELEAVERIERSTSELSAEAASHIREQAPRSLSARRRRNENALRAYLEAAGVSVPHCA